MPSLAVAVCALAFGFTPAAPRAHLAQVDTPSAAVDDGLDPEAVARRLESIDLRLRQLGERERLSPLIGRYFTEKLELKQRRREVAPPGPAASGLLARF